MRIISELGGNVDGGYSPTERQGAKAIKIYVRRSAVSAFAVHVKYTSKCGLLTDS